MRAEINEIAVLSGNDPMLVQGAGGNISWKDGDSLYVKGSGTWLADAGQRDIYVAMGLEVLRGRISAGLVDFAPAVVFAPSGLRPSIETALHALLPQKVVLHLHPVDVIALSVTSSGMADIARRLNGLDWAWVDYAKPGKELAEAVMAERTLHAVPPRIWVLGNHGLVVADESVAAVNVLLGETMERLALPFRSLKGDGDIPEALLGLWRDAGYRPASDGVIHALAYDIEMREMSKTAWVLYPDHAVFLGERAGFARSPEELLPGEQPVVVVLPNMGVMLRSDAPKAAECMLRCYVEVLARIPAGAQPKILPPAAIADLLDWDAEKLRRNAQRAV